MLSLRLTSLVYTERSRSVVISLLRDRLPHHAKKRDSQ